MSALYLLEMFLHTPRVNSNPISLINYLDAEKLALIVFEDETVALKEENNYEQ